MVDVIIDQNDMFLTASMCEKLSISKTLIKEVIEIGSDSDIFGLNELKKMEDIVDELTVLVDRMDDVITDAIS